MRNRCKILAGKSEEKRSLGRSRCTWENNIKIDLKQGECRGDLTASGHDPVAGSCEDGNEPLGFLKRRETSLSLERLCSFLDGVQSMQLDASRPESICFLVTKRR
jgi:hypothetical protein